TGSIQGFSSPRSLRSEPSLLHYWPEQKGQRPDRNFARTRPAKFVRAGPAPKTAEMRGAIFNGGCHQWFVRPNEEVRCFRCPVLTDCFRRTSAPVDQPGSTPKPLLASPATRPTVRGLGSW